LHEAAAAGHTEAAKVLLSIGATPDVTDKVNVLPSIQTLQAKLAIFKKLYIIY